MRLVPLVTAVMATAAACTGVIGGSGDSGGGDPTFGSAHPRIYLGPNKDRLMQALSAKTAAAVRFQSMVDQQIGGANIYSFYNWNAALMTQLTGDAKYCKFAVAAIDEQVQSANASIESGTAPDVTGDDYLYVGDDIGDLAIVYDWCADDLSGDQQKAWLAYGQQAVANIWNNTQATWDGQSMPWDGWSIHDPGDNYYYSFLRATMLFGLAAHDDLPAANQWLTVFHDQKIENELIPDFDSELVGGGSREGTSYGEAMRRLFELYDWWQASTGEDLASQTPHTRASMIDFMHSVVPSLNYLAPTGDQARDSTAAFFDYDRQYLQELVSEFPTDPQAGRAMQLLASSSIPAMTEKFQYVYDFLYDNSTVTPQPLDGFGTAYYGSGTGQLFGRSGWGLHDSWFNLIGGPYTESHEHQDQGALTIYKDGWLADDEVINTKSGLAQDTTVHNVVRILDDNGDTVAQAIGSAGSVVALHSGPGWVHAAIDVSPMYASNSAVQKVQREVVYIAPDCWVVYDRVAIDSGASAVFQIATPQAPSLTSTGATMSSTGHTLNIQNIGATSVSNSVHSFTDDGDDFMSGYRYDEQIAGGTSGTLHVIWIDSDVSSATADGSAAAAGSAGVDLTFADGSTAVVTFDPSAVNGSLSIETAERSNINAQLTPGVDPLPENAQ